MKPHETILITGAARRIGAHMAKVLASDGHRIVIHYHKSAREAEALRNTIRDGGGTAHTLEGDLAEQSVLETLTGRAAELAGAPVSVLINNASTFLQDREDALDPGTWDTNFGVNLKAPVFLSSRFADQVPERQTGHIINMIDQAVLSPAEGFTSYTLAKSALWTATRTLALAFAPRIRVNAIGPGPALQSRHQTEEEFAAEVQSLPLGRGPDLDEFPRAVRFLLETPSITGQMLTLDGGQHLSS